MPIDKFSKTSTFPVYINPGTTSPTVKGGVDSSTKMGAVTNIVDMSDINPGDLIDTEEAAAILGTTRGTLEVWRHQGKPPAYCKINRLVRYYKPWLLDYVKSQFRVSTSQA